MFDALHPRRFAGRNPEAAAVGRLFVYLAAVRVWAGLVATGYARIAPPTPDGIASVLVAGTFVSRVLGFGLPAAVYVAYRGLRVPTGLPDADEYAGVFAAVAVPLGLVAVLGVVGNFVFGTSVSELTQHSHSRSVGPLFVVQATLVPAAFAALGTGALVHGAVQTRLRDLTTPAHAVLLTPVVAGVFYLLPMETLTSSHVDAPLLALFGLGVLASVLLGACLGLLYRGLVHDALEEVLRIEYLPLLVAGALGVLSVGHSLVYSPQAVTQVLWLVVLGTGAYAYERTRSVWSPIVAILLYRAALGLAVTIEVFSGLAPLP